MSNLTQHYGMDYSSVIKKVGDILLCIVSSTNVSSCNRR